MVHMVEEMIHALSEKDKEVAQIIEEERKRQQQNLELIASENIVSEAVLMATGSILTNKYAEGYPHKRYYGGCEHVDKVEELAISRAKQLFGAEHVNVQPHSGSQANEAVYTALLQRGDTVMGMDLTEGGHLTHGSLVNFSGKNYQFHAYGVDQETQTIDYDAVQKKAEEIKPRMIVCGASAYARTIDFQRFREIADAVGAYLMVDMAHIAGLVAAGLHPSPIPYADVVTTTTHKTLRGPRGGIILCKEAYAKAIDKAVFPGTQGGPLMHTIASKAICFGEALGEDFRRYIQKVVKNSQALSEGLKKRGIRIVSGGTDTHLFLIDLRDTGVTGQELERRLDQVHITVNKNTIPNEPLSKFVTSGIRVGTPSITTRGFEEGEMDEIAQLMTQAIRTYEQSQESITKRVQALCERHPIYG